LKPHIDKQIDITIHMRKLNLIYFPSVIISVLQEMTEMGVPLDYYW